MIDLRPLYKKRNALSKVLNEITLAIYECDGTSIKSDTFIDELESVRDTLTNLRDKIDTTIKQDHADFAKRNGLDTW